MKINITILVALCISFVSCKKEEKTKIVYDIIKDPIYAYMLRNSPDTLNIENNILYLTTNLYRDFEFQFEIGAPIICINYLTDRDKVPIPESLLLKNQIIIKGDSIWTNEYWEIRRFKDYIVEGRVLAGPRWGPEINVDVICEFEYKDSIYRIIAKDQVIRRIG